MEPRPGTILEHDAPYVNVLTDTLRGSIIIRWKNYAPSGTYRATLNMACELINEHKLHYFLTDQRRRGAILNADEHWLATDWSPRMARTTLKRAAIVQSTDFFNHTAIDRVVRTVLPVIPYPIKYFKTMEEAEEWLFNTSEVSSTPR